MILYVYLITVLVFFVLGFFKTPYFVIGTFFVSSYVGYVFYIWRQESAKMKELEVRESKKRRERGGDEAYQPQDNLLAALDQSGGLGSGNSRMQVNQSPTKLLDAVMASGNSIDDSVMLEHSVSV